MVVPYFTFVPLDVAYPVTWMLLCSDHVMRRYLIVHRLNGALYDYFLFL